MALHWAKVTSFGFGLMLNAQQYNSYDHAGMVISPNHTVFLFGLMLNSPVKSFDHAGVVNCLPYWFDA